ncbi:hypothetical protein [Amycolatopsis sp. H20-H5]|uniref:hypothetical protein n=1 Tax=Amycolatopsis sp. H20-H5 TaxID=3046309 RepID=UPI002DBEC3F8|nr:hypothetical protein [Amycolatopsis sp. H20-H5]MEC3982133.1 hypothetical protein [Amycolatopsis sp. H20-H5]
MNTDPHGAPARTDLPFLRRRTRRAPAAPVPSTLDLSATTIDTVEPPRRPARVAGRARSGGRTVLAPDAPTVTLTRLQSGIGVLRIAANAPDLLRLGCAYALADGSNAAVRHDDATSARAPVVAADRRRPDLLTVDLRQSRKLKRMIVYGVAAGDPPPGHEGVLTVTTWGGTRLELPLEPPPPLGVTVYLSIYNIDGEFVVRAESDPLDGPVRAAWQAYGFDRITAAG